MSSELLNPYEALTPERSLARGLRIAFSLSLAGFALPYLIGIACYLIFQTPSPYQSPPGIDWAELHGTFVVPAIGCALVFALASILNFTPATRIGFVRSLLLVSVVALMGITVCGAVSIAFGLNRKSSQPVAWAWVPAAITILIPIAYTLIHTIVECARPKDEQPHLMAPMLE